MTACTISDMERESPKLLVVTGNKLNSQVVEYALKVAVRLDLEIVVLFVDEETFYSNEEQRRRAVERFNTEVKAEAAGFAGLAWKMEVKVTTIVDVSDRESAIAKAIEQETKIRFILSGGVDTEAGNNEGKAHPRLSVIRTV